MHAYLPQLFYCDAWVVNCPLLLLLAVQKVVIQKQELQVVKVAVPDLARKC